MPSEFNQHASWPTDSDVLAPQGASAEQVTAARLAAIRAFKQETHYPAFIAGADNDGAATTEYFDGPGTNFLNLDGGYVSISQVKTGISYGASGTADAGSGAVIYAPNTFRFRHEPDSSGPITWLDGSSGCGFGWGALSIAITGVRGAYTYCPDDVWQAIIDETVARVAAALSAGDAGSGTKRYSVGRGDEEREVFDPLRALAMIGTNGGFLSTAMRTAVAHYKRT